MNVKIVERSMVKLSENVYWVGVRDWNRRLFDALIPLPKGTSYNAYLVTGSEDNALIDTVNPGFEKKLEEKIRVILDPGKIDYVIMNHAEPDHAGAIPHVMRLAPKAKLIATSRGAKMARIFYDAPQERIKTVADQETLSLGGKLFDSSRHLCFTGLKQCLHIYRRMGSFSPATSSVPTWLRDFTTTRLETCLLTLKGIGVK